MKTILRDAKTGIERVIDVNASFVERPTTKVVVDPERNWVGQNGIARRDVVYEIQYNRSRHGDDWASRYTESAASLRTQQERLRRKGYRQQQVVEHRTQGEVYDCYA